MTTIETAEQFALTITRWGTSKYPSWAMTVSEIVAARDAAIREATAREVLDRVAQMVAASIVADDGGQAVTMPRISELRREFCPTPTPTIATPEVLKGDKSEKLADAMDEAICRETAKKVLSEVWEEYKKSPVEAGSLTESRSVGAAGIRLVAARHGIDLEELEEKKYTVGDIELKSFDFVIDGEMWRIVCGEWSWFSKDGWQQVDAGTFYSKFDAEAIAAHLRATNNLPGGGK